MVLVKRGSSLSNVRITTPSSSSYHVPCGYGDVHALHSTYPPSPADSFSPESGTRTKFSFDGSYGSSSNQERHNHHHHHFISTLLKLPDFWMYRMLFAVVVVIGCCGVGTRWYLGRSQNTGIHNAKMGQIINATPSESILYSDQQYQNIKLAQTDSDMVQSDQHQQHPLKLGLEYHLPNLKVHNHHHHHQQQQQQHQPEQLLVSETGTIIEESSRHERVMALQAKINNLQHYIQRKSHQHILETFGPGPTFRVKFTIEFMNSDDTSSLLSSSLSTTNPRKAFVVETASIELVPHVVSTFLDMVSHGLWNKTVFWHHDRVNHVISAAPLKYDSTKPTGSSSRQSHQDEFDQMALVKGVSRQMSFAEYSPLFPHVKYTLGFANKGPSFYINTQDNVGLHGPGGQGHHDLPEEADPCFGRVVDGLDVIEELYQTSIHKGKKKKKKTQDSIGQQQHHQQESVKEGTVVEDDWHHNILSHIVSVEVL